MAGLVEHKHESRQPGGTDPQAHGQKSGCGAATARQPKSGGQGQWHQQVLLDLCYQEHLAVLGQLIVLLMFVENQR